MGESKTNSLENLGKQNLSKNNMPTKTRERNSNYLISLGSKAKGEATPKVNKLIDKYKDTEPLNTRSKTKKETLKETRALYKEVTEEPFFNKANATSEKQKSSSEEPKKKGFDPDTLQISTLNVPQLIGWINNQRGSTDDKLLELSRPELMAIAKKIKVNNALK